MGEAKYIYFTSLKYNPRSLTFFYIFLGERPFLELNMSRRLTQSTIRWADLKARMPSRYARQLYDATEGAARKHMEAIASMEASKPSIDWNGYAKVIKGESDIVHEFKAKYAHIEIPYPDDVDNRMGAAERKDLQIKEIRDLVMKNVIDRTSANNKDRTFFRRLPEARSMTVEMYMEAFPQRDIVKPRSREQLEGETETVVHHLDEYAKKREERQKYRTY